MELKKEKIRALLGGPDGTYQLLFRWCIPPVTARRISRRGRPAAPRPRMDRRASANATVSTGRAGGTAAFF